MTNFISIPEKITIREVSVKNTISACYTRFSKQTGTKDYFLKT